MCTLLHYLKTQVDFSDFHPQNLICYINERASLVFNEQFERQYEDLNAVDKYVVDNSQKFRRGKSLTEIMDDGGIASYKATGIAKKLRATCTFERMTTKRYLETIAANDHCELIFESRVMVYRLKPKEQIQDLYAILAYTEHQSASLDDEQDEDDEPSKVRVKDDEE